MSETTRQMTKRPNPATSVKGIAGSVILGAVVAAAGGVGGFELGGAKAMWLAAFVAFGINWLAFVPANAAQTEKYYDLTGSVAYLSVIALTVIAVGRWDARSLILVALIGTWTIRLGLFLFLRINRDGHDRRFDRIKTDPLRFLMMWSTQGLWVFLTLAAALAALTAPTETPLGVWALLGVVVWLFGFAIEVVADRQKSAFRAEPKNKGRWIGTGLWAWSRHPNYFGEITLWCGIALIAVPTLAGWRWITLISPLFVYLLLTRLSGVPMLEKGADRRWGTEAAYQEYKAATPSLVLRPPQSRAAR